MIEDWRYAMRAGIDAMEKVMTEDIVERLKLGETTPIHHLPDLCREAAVEIERLRATIDQLRSVAGAVSLDSGLTFKEIKQGLPQLQDAGVMLPRSNV